MSRRRRMSEAAAAAFLAAATALLSFAATRALIPLLRRRDILDRPNPRSSHEVPTPRGGGIAVVATVLFTWTVLVAAGAALPRLPAVLLAALLLAIVSWLDDLYGLPPLPRLVAQAAAVGLGLLAVPGGPLFLAAAALAWLWFINLFNFMDGIDGLAGGEAAMIGAGLALFATLGNGLDPAPALLAAAITGAALGFLWWNWSPARIFLGDVGSVPLGYLIGFLLIDLAARGRWRIALILPLYFLADATLTLLRRLRRGAPVWRAHREHFYQRAVAQGLGHSAVVGRVLAVDLILIGCGWAAENGWEAISLGIAAASVTLLLAMLAAGR
jgi:UDP-N-acetylmuramyl pentapeptide phosphotransferase/UDP-N-acetylglucosamine-1-phosphate transferase